MAFGATSRTVGPGSFRAGFNENYSWARSGADGSIEKF
jgi:hypothetical protein